MLGVAFLTEGCTTNPATGEQQFSVISQSQEKSIGASNHQAILDEYGGLYNDSKIQSYVSDIGQRLVKVSETPNEQFRFFVVDSPEFNAFAVPGGYIYMTRGALTVATSEAEVASILAHEIGHITARHGASRQTTGVLTGIGAAILQNVVNAPGLGDALNLGSNLYMSSYSRDQEREADTLGIRYLHRAGYDPYAAARMFGQLYALEQYESATNPDKANSSAYFFRSHPLSQERIGNTRQEAAKYAKNDSVNNHDSYLRTISGLEYGDSSAQGFVRDGKFIHPSLGFSFMVPSGYDVVNKPQQVVIARKSGPMAIFDGTRQPGGIDPVTYVRDFWLKGKNADPVEAVTVNGMAAATSTVRGTVNGAPTSVRVMAIAYSPQDIFRFQVAVPSSISAGELDQLKRMTYSLQPLTAADKAQIKPMRIAIVTAKAGDTVNSLGASMSVSAKHNKPALFRVINGLNNGESVVTGQQYKVIY